MNQQERIDKLSEIIEKQEPYTYRKIWYKDEPHKMDVYEVPLDYLAYNPYNGRIMSIVQTFEKQFRKLDTNNDEDRLLIERFIWDSAPDYNKQTVESLKKYGQNEIGIVTKDGIIIDGNRRACLLNYLNKQDGENRKFLTVILEDSLEGNKEEINSLETIYQIGVDDKVDYNPIEKYLKSRELLKFFAVPKIAEMMSVEDKVIETYLGTLELMDKYLAKYDYEGIYTRLNKREGHFVDLFTYLKSYRKNGKNQNVDWEYTEQDIEDLINIYFDYIRLGIPVASCRIIGRSKKSDSFFCNRTIWPVFKAAHQEALAEYKELSVKEFKKQYGGDDINKIIIDRETQWIEHVQLSLFSNLDDSSRILNDRKALRAPLELLNRASNILNQINCDSLSREDIERATNILYLIKLKISEIEETFILLEK